MKKFMVVVLMTALVAGLAGCGSTSEERIAMYKQIVDRSVAASQKADSYLPQVNEAIAESEAAFAAGLPADQAAAVQAKIESGKKIKAEILAGKAVADKAAIEAQAKIDAIIERGDTGFAGELEAIGGMMDVAGKVLPPPAGPYVTLSGILVGIIGAAFGRKATKTAAAEKVKATDAEESAAYLQAKYYAHKAGAEAARVALSALSSPVAGSAAAELIYSKIGEKRAELGVN